MVACETESNDVQATQKQSCYTYKLVGMEMFVLYADSSSNGPSRRLSEIKLWSRSLREASILDGDRLETGIGNSKCNVQFHWDRFA
jgi:hypothetical protein